VRSPLRRRAARRTGAAFACVVSAAAGCSDFTPSRDAPPRGTFGREFYTVLCDRVGAQSLREDITGVSFHDMCHTDTSGTFPSTTVDTSLLPPLTATTTPDGDPVTLAQQQAQRAHDVARVDALGLHRQALITAFDAALPATTTPEQPIVAGECPDPDAAQADSSGRLELQPEFSAILGRLVDLYNDETIPTVTRAFGDAMNQVKVDQDLQVALARMDARQGYRPLPFELGVARPAFAYPRLVELARALVAVLLGDGTTIGAQAFVQTQAVAYQELRTPATTLLASLASTPDPLLGGRLVLNRPRSLLESMRDVALNEDPAFMVGTPTYVVRRDPRGYASVPLVGGVIPPPFVDSNGDAGVAVLQHRRGQRLARFGRPCAPGDERIRPSLRLRRRRPDVRGGARA
jgi:hypothetical protein